MIIAAFSMPDIMNFTFLLGCVILMPFFLKYKTLKSILFLLLFKPFQTNHLGICSSKWGLKTVFKTLRI